MDASSGSCGGTCCRATCCRGAKSTTAAGAVRTRALGMHEGPKLSTSVKSGRDQRHPGRVYIWTR